MITKDDLRQRLHNMVSIFLISALISMCGFIVAPELAIRVIDPNTLTIFKFLIITGFIIHIMGMVSIGVLLVGDTMERVVDNTDEIHYRQMVEKARFFVGRHAGAPIANEWLEEYQDVVKKEDELDATP